MSEFIKVTTWVPLTDTEAEEVTDGLRHDLARMIIERSTSLCYTAKEVEASVKDSPLKLVAVGLKIERSHGGDLVSHLNDMK